MAISRLALLEEGWVVLWECFRLPFVFLIFFSPSLCNQEDALLAFVIIMRTNAAKQTLQQGGGDGGVELQPSATTNSTVALPCDGHLRTTYLAPYTSMKQSKFIGLGRPSVKPLWSLAFHQPASDGGRGLKRTCCSWWKVAEGCCEDERLMTTEHTPHRPLCWQSTRHHAGLLADEAPPVTNNKPDPDKPPQSVKYRFGQALGRVASCPGLHQ